MEVKKKGPYKEVDTAVPKAVYGKNKLEVEEKLPDILDEYWVVRFTLAFRIAGKRLHHRCEYFMGYYKSSIPEPTNQGK